MRSKNFRAIAIASVVGLLCVGVGMAPGADSVKTNVKITEGGPEHFEGKVTSPESKCEKRRKVTLEYKFGGPYKRGTVVGTDKTNAKGKWSIEGAFQAGLYRAVVEEDEKGDLTCRFDRTIRMEF
jgi:hypothetical protein